jgi:L-2-hydroxyglutarate oxidase LhgO
LNTRKCPALYGTQYSLRVKRYQKFRKSFFANHYIIILPSMIAWFDSCRFPMVGVHLTPRVDGRVLIGPNAALALAKEGYSFWRINIRDILVFATTKGLWKLVLGNPSTVFTEVWRDINKRAFVAEAQRYILLFVRH